LSFQPAHQRFEIIHHCARGDVFARRFFQNFAPVFRATFFENVIQPCADFLVVGIITGLRRLMQNFARDVVVQLNFVERILRLELSLNSRALQSQHMHVLRSSAAADDQIKMRRTYCPAPALIRLPNFRGRDRCSPQR